MIGKLVKFIIFIAIFCLFIYRYFYYIDFSERCYIKLKPSLTELSSQNIKQAIKVLKYAVPGEYQKFCSHVKKINPNIACAGFNGGCYYQYNLEKKEIDVSTANSSNLGWTASVIAHETCHAIQHQEGRELSEDECYRKSSEILRATIKF